ncbi:MAG: hypothetical protein QNJ32_25205 [Xenococcaceae cyanobacterium MO_167.B27]|nr:hypothetical protein [Xenococcaceae cyanobacterium MO_167.B27]
MMTNRYFRNIAYLATILGIVSYVPLGLTQTVTESPVFRVARSPATLQIISITRDGDRESITSDKPITVTIEATPGVRASVLLVADKHTISETSAREISPGIYQATIYFDSNTRIVEGVIMARLQRGKQVIYDAANRPFSVVRAETQPGFTIGGSQSSLFTRNNFNSPNSQVAVNSNIPLNFTSHRNGEIVNGNNLLIMGETQPNAEVSIKVSSSLSLIGNFLELEGVTLVEQTVIADKKGNFSFTIPHSKNTVSGLKYTINAIAMVQNQTSQSVELTLVQN